MASAPEIATPSIEARRPTRRWWLAGVTALLGVVAGAAYASAAPRTYLARAYVLAVAQQSGDEAAARNFAQAFGRIAAHPEVIGALASGPERSEERPATSATPRAAASSPTPAQSTTQPGASAAELRRTVHAATSPDAPVIEITGSAGEPGLAADRANLVAEALVSYANRRSAETRMRMVLLSRAYPPSGAAAPRRDLAITVGAATGLLAGGFAVLAGFGRRTHRTKPRYAPVERPGPGWRRDETLPIDQHRADPDWMIRR